MEGKPAPEHVKPARMTVLEVLVPTDVVAWARDLWAMMRLSQPDNVPASFRDFNAAVLTQGYMVIRQNLEAQTEKQAVAPAMSQNFCGIELSIRRPDNTPISCARPQGHEGEHSGTYDATEWKI
jgi:hypothetical protein